MYFFGFLKIWTVIFYEMTFFGLKVESATLFHA